MKKLLITEEQLNLIILEELGIVKDVIKASKELKHKLFNYIEKYNSGEFCFLDIKVIYNVFSFDSENELYNWLDKNNDKYLNGYSHNNKTLYLTIIKINDKYNITSLDDTIQHELEHYYQTKKAAKNFSKQNYRNAYTKLNDYNDYIKNISYIEYFNNLEIDACVNGAYSAAQNLIISDYNSFIEQTDLSHVKNRLKEAFNYFNNKPFKGVFFEQMLIFIKENNYYKKCENLSELRKEILKKCKKQYEYFIRKSSRAYALIKSKEYDFDLEKSKNNIEKLNRYLKNGK